MRSREQRKRALWCAPAAGVMLAAGAALAVDVDGVITVDNAYGFGFGDENGMTTSTYFGGIRNTTAGEITNGTPTLFTQGDANSGNGFTNPGIGPELYDLNGLPASDYMYLVAWSDDFQLQGALATFTVGAQSVGTVPGIGWEVYATGIDRDSQTVGDTLTNSAADIALMNQQIALANDSLGGAGTSVGWVDENGLLPDDTPGTGALVFGDDNTGGSGGTHPFGSVQGIDSSARWMWYNEDPANIPNPFDATPAGNDGHNEFLIFRIPVSAVPSPGSGALLALGAAGLLRRRR